jgi:hypothetical protein
MQEIIFWAAVVIGVLTLLVILPLTREIVKPVYGQLLTWLMFVVQEALLWVWYFFKLIIRAHFDLVENFINRRSDYDAEAMLKKLKTDKRKERRG